MNPEKASKLRGGAGSRRQLEMFGADRGQSSLSVNGSSCPRTLPTPQGNAATKTSQDKAKHVQDLSKSNPRNRSGFPSTFPSPMRGNFGSTNSQGTYLGPPQTSQSGTVYGLSPPRTQDTLSSLQSGPEPMDTSNYSDVPRKCVNFVGLPNISDPDYSGNDNRGNAVSTSPSGLTFTTLQPRNKGDGPSVTSSRINKPSKLLFSIFTQRVRFMISMRCIINEMWRCR